jgi:hypothetical protein
MRLGSDNRMASTLTPHVITKALRGQSRVQNNLITEVSVTNLEWAIERNNQRGE